MIKELRETLGITISELSFVLDIEEEQIREWEQTNKVPENILKILHKRYSQYFNKNDKGKTILKKTESKENNSNKVTVTKLDKLFQNHTTKKSKTTKNTKKIVVRKKKDNVSDNIITQNEDKAIESNANNIQETTSIKKEKESPNLNNRKAVPIKENNNNEFNIPAEYIKSLINDNKTESFSGLRDIRKYLKISQTELGEILEINQRKISIWEITNAKLPKEIIEKIAKKFNIELNLIKHLIGSDELKYLLENLPIRKDSIFFDKEIDSLNIQAIRKAFGHSLRSFANEIGVHYQTVARWEKGHGMLKDYILKEVIDKFLSRKSLKLLLDKNIDVGLKEEYAHWENDLENTDDFSLEISNSEVKNIIDKRLELLKILEEEGLEVDLITVNSNKSISLKSDKYNFCATFILNDKVKDALKKLF